jgi:hypothetical protein
MRAAPGACLIFVALVESAASRAADEGASPIPMTWVGPVTCPSEADVKLQIERLLGQSLESEREPGLAFRATVRERERGGYELELRVADKDGEHVRTLEHEECRKLAEAAALLIALAIDPERVQTEKDGAEAPSSPPPRSAPDAARSDRAARVRQTARTTHSRAQAGRRPWPPATSSARPRRSLDGRVGTYAWLGFGSLPHPSPGISAELGWVYDRTVRLSGYAAGWLEQNETIADAPEGAQVVIGLLTAGALACWTLAREPWETSACLGAELGDLTGSGDGQGVQKPVTKHARWSAALVQTGVGYRLSRQVLAVVRTAGGLALERPRFGVDRGGYDQEVFQPKQGLVRAGIGLELALP